MTKGIHRVTANSKSGRRMTHAKGAQEANLIPLTQKMREQREWNRQVEEQKKLREEHNKYHNIEQSLLPRINIEITK